MQSRRVKPSRMHSMADHDRVVQRTNLLAAGFLIGTCALALSAAAQQGSAVAYSTNGLDMQFASVPSGSFPMGCSEGVKPVECGLADKPRHILQITEGLELGKTAVTP